MKIKPKQAMYNGISYNFFDRKSDKICFMLSGTGYTYDKPILYYSTALMLELGMMSSKSIIHLSNSNSNWTPKPYQKWSIVLPTRL